MDILTDIRLLWFIIVALVVTMIFGIKKIRTMDDKLKVLIEAHNAMATDFSQSMHFIKRFNEAIDAEDKT